MTDLTPERLAELRAVAERATEPDHYVCGCTAWRCLPEPEADLPINRQRSRARPDRRAGSANESKPSNSVTSGSANERELADLRAAAPGDDATELAITVHQLLGALEAKTAEVDDLAADPGHKAAKYWKWWQREKARADRAEAALERVKALHKDDRDESCGWCHEPWPCRTIRELEAGATDE